MGLLSSYSGMRALPLPDALNKEYANLLIDTEVI
jgi:hypothetical protein